MATDLTIAQKKEYAGVLYLKDNLTQQEIAEKVGVSRQTLSKMDQSGKVGRAQSRHYADTRRPNLQPAQASGGNKQGHHGARSGQTLRYTLRSRYVGQTGGCHQEDGK